MNSALWRRLRLYFTGFALGLVAVVVLFWRTDDRDLDKWTPEQRILEAIREDSAFQSSPALQCYAKCLGLSQSQLDDLWKNAQVKSLNPGGNPYRYQLATALPDSVVAVVEQREIHRLLSMQRAGKGQSCACHE